MEGIQNSTKPYKCHKLSFHFVTFLIYELALHYACLLSTHPADKRILVTKYNKFPRSTNKFLAEIQLFRDDSDNINVTIEAPTTLRSVIAKMNVLRPMAERLVRG